METQATILVGDRNGNVRKLIERELAQEGYRVVLAGDGRELLKALDSDLVPDVVVMDLALPFVDGLIILGELKRRENRPRVVIFTSMDECRDDPLVKSADAFIDKEDGLSRLKSAIVEVLASSPAPKGGGWRQSGERL